MFSGILDINQKESVSTAKVPHPNEGLPSQPLKKRALKFKAKRQKLAKKMKANLN
jgi:hypothetical protein